MRRILAILLSLTMIFCCLPAGVFADEVGPGGNGEQNEVEKIDISTYHISYLPKTITYDGTAHYPSHLYVEKLSPFESLRKDQDFTVEVTDNINVGDMLVIVRGIGRFCGEVQFKIPIKPKELKSCYFDVDEYTAEGQKPNIKLYFGKTHLVENQDYVVEEYTEKGNEGTIKVRGIGNYDGTASHSYRVGFDIDKADIKLSADTYVYNGHYFYPSVTVTHGGERLNEGYDYRVTYKNHKEVGTASIVVTGIGRYHGEKTVFFTIKGKEQKVTPKKETYEAYVRSEPFKIEASASGDGTGFLYTSNNPAVATVDAEGMVKAHSPGDAVITLKTTGMKAYAEASASVTVHVNLSSISFGTVLAEEKGLSAIVNKLTGERIVSASVKIGDMEYPCTIKEQGECATVECDYPKQAKGAIVVLTAKDDQGQEITKTAKVMNAVIELSANKIYDKSIYIKGKTYPGMTVKTKLGGKTYQGKAGANGAYSIKIPKQKIGRTIKLTALSENGSSKSITKRVYKRTDCSAYCKYYVLRTSKYVTVKCSGVVQGDMVKVKINGKLYKKKVSKSSGSPSVKIYTGKHATGSAIHVYIYNSYNQRLCYSKDKVYFGKTLYVGMTSKQALQTTWGKPTDRYSYPGYQVWIFQSGDTVVFAYISGGRVIKLASPIY